MSQPEPEAADQVGQWITLLQGHIDEYGGELSPSDFDSYQAQLDEIAGVLRDHSDQAAECQTNLIELVGRYPSVGQWLVGVDPTYRDLPGVNEPPAVEPAADPAQAEVTPVTPVEPDPGPAQPPAEAVATVPAPALVRAEAPEVPATTQTVSAVPAQASLPARARTWTPDVWMQVGKEVVTATIALVIIGSTIALVARSFGLIGNASHVSQAKNLIGIMLGLVGTVTGYYFGRVPADARATSATARAEQATTDKERVQAQARHLADQMDDIITSPTSLNMLATGGDLVTHQDNLKKVRNGLRQIGSP